jgi:Flp pilus assembly pilin Flp
MSSALDPSMPLPLLAALWRDEGGGSHLEYAIIGMFGCGALIATWRYLATGLDIFYRALADTLGSVF